MLYKPFITSSAFGSISVYLEKIGLNGNSITYDDLLPNLFTEWLKVNHPEIQFEDKDYSITYPKEWHSFETNANWVVYPWLNKAIRICGENEFIAIRTNRNQLKITAEEQKMLASKTIAIIGLSVGMSIALTIAMERIAGHIILADFDIAELSNLNRIQTKLTDLYAPKAITTARYISEIDPYIKITVFENGVTAENISAVFDLSPHLILEECDALPVKWLVRHWAKQHKVPVIMETNDRGLIDIERYDIIDNLPLLHGLMEDLNYEYLYNVTGSERINLVLKIAGGSQISPIAMASLKEIGKSIRTWPQLASAVMLGAGMATHFSRKLLLNQNVPTGRFYIDLDKLVL